MRAIFRKQKKLQYKTKDDIDVTSSTSATTASTVMSDAYDNPYYDSHLKSHIPKVQSPTTLSSSAPRSSQDVTPQSERNEQAQVNPSCGQFYWSPVKKSVKSDNYNDGYLVYQSDDYRSDQKYLSLPQQYQRKQQSPPQDNTIQFVEANSHISIHERRDNQDDESERNFMNKFMSAVTPFYQCGASFADKAQITNGIQCGNWQRHQDYDDASACDDRSFVTTSTLLEEMYLLERMNSWSTLGTVGTLNTASTTNSYLKKTEQGSNNVGHKRDSSTSSIIEEKCYYDDDGNLIHPEVVKAHEMRRIHIAQQNMNQQNKHSELTRSGVRNVQPSCLRTKKTKRKERRKVTFHYPPVQSLRQIPRIDPATKNLLFFTEEELKQFENEGYEADDSFMESNIHASAYFSAKELARSYSDFLAEQENWLQHGPAV